MMRLGIEIGDQLWPVPRTIAAPGICYRTNPVRVTVAGFGIGDLVDVTEPDGTPHTMSVENLSRTAPRARCSMARKPAQPMDDSEKTYEEIPLF